MNILSTLIEQNKIEKRDSGIYYSKIQEEISYPEEGNENFMEIEENSFWFKHRNNIIVHAVKKYSPDQVLFDIGGGNGFVAMGLESQGIQTVLVEPGAKGAVNASKRGLPNILCSTLECAGFEQKSIPSVGLFDVVEHIKDDNRFLMNINNFLCDNGLIYLTVPAYNSLWSNEDVDAGHYRRYTLNQIIKTLEKANFEIEYATYLFAFLPLPIFFFRSVPSKLGFNKKSEELNKHKKEHRERATLAGKLLNKFLKWELKNVISGRRIRMGSSCFVVARKK